MDRAGGARHRLSQAHPAGHSLQGGLRGARSRYPGVPPARNLPPHDAGGAAADRRTMAGVRRAHLGPGLSRRLLRLAGFRDRNPALRGGRDPAWRQGAGGQRAGAKERGGGGVGVPAALFCPTPCFIPSVFPDHAGSGRPRQRPRPRRGHIRQKRATTATIRPPWPRRSAANRRND